MKLGDPLKKKTMSFCFFNCVMKTSIFNVLGERTSQLSKLYRSLENTALAESFSFLRYWLHTGNKEEEGW